VKVQPCILVVDWFETTINWGRIRSLRYPSQIQVSEWGFGLKFEVRFAQIKVRLGSGQAVSKQGSRNWVFPSLEAEPSNPQMNLKLGIKVRAPYLLSYY